MAGQDPYELWQDSTPESADNYYSTGLIQWAIDESTKILDTLTNSDDVRNRFIELWRDGFQAGLLPHYFSGRRTFEKQRQLYDKYVKGEGNIAARPGNSFHNYGRAVDMQVLAHDGQGQLAGGLTKLQAINKDKKLGLTWGGVFNDPNHFDFRERSIDELKNSDPTYLAWIQGEPYEASEQEQIQNWKEETLSETDPLEGTTFWSRNKGIFIAGGVTLLAIGIILIVTWSTAEAGGAKKGKIKTA